MFFFMLKVWEIHVSQARTDGEGRLFRIVHIDDILVNSLQQSVNALLDRVAHEKAVHERWSGQEKE